MTERDRLIEVMARAAFQNNMPECVWEHSESCAEVFIADTKAALAAAERAGFKWTKRDE